MFAPRRPWVMATLLLLAAEPVGAAEITEVIDAGDPDDPYDFTAEITYGRSLRRAKITREYNCDPVGRPADAETCPDAAAAGHGALVHVKELRYERVVHELTPRLRFAIWRDLELAVEAPIVLSDEQHIRFAGNGGKKNGTVITPENSSVAPGPRSPTGPDPVDLFPVPPDLPTRAGFGDMLFMLRWAPFSQERDRSRADWVVEVGYRAPTGEVMRPDNEGVGRGVHELVFGTAFSRRYRYLDPYARFDLALPFPAGDSMFKDYGDAQEHVGPGLRGGFETGLEIVPYEDTERDVKFFIDVGLGATYHGEGRDYSILFDALALGARESAAQCEDPAFADDPNCARFNPESRSEIAGQPHDGLTTVEQYVTFKSKLGIGLQASRYFRLTAQVGLDHDTEHFVSNADVGRDRDGSGLVENKTDPRYDPREHNPTYVPAIDAVGRRLRVEETTVFTFGFTASLIF